MSVYAYNDYLEYLNEKLKQTKHSQLAQAAGMHPSYLSRILHGSIHLTPDQAAGLCQFWVLDPEETNYFLNLVHKARAGSPALKKILEAELKSARERHQDLGEHLTAQKVENEKEKENLYYSAWYYSAVHILLTIPSFQTEPAICEKLNLPPEEVRKILEGLEKIDLVKRNRNKWEPTTNNIHMKNTPLMAAVHHINWRGKIAEKIQFRNPENLHYTGVHTLSRSDFKKIRELLLDALVRVDQVVRPSKEEELCCLVVDWTRL